ncbi:hypothetical protein HDU86_005756 [Geranomyces michiganensis]|nr:hypothetical protein HDU86_005756 [Geranomyces michiganensis]
MAAPPSLFPPAQTPVYLLTTRLAAPSSSSSSSLSAAAASLQSSPSSSSSPPPPPPPPPYTLEKLPPLQQLLASATVAGQIVTHCHPASILHDRIITLALSRFAYTASLVTRVTGSFVLHLLEEHQAHLVPTFGTHSSRNFNKFSPSEVACTLSPMLHHPLVSGSAAWCECVVEQIVDVEAERVVVIARVVNRGGGGGRPLTMDTVRKRVTKDELAALDASWARDTERDSRLAEIEEARGVASCPQLQLQQQAKVTAGAGTQTELPGAENDSQCASHPQLGPGPLLKARL